MLSVRSRIKGKKLFYRERSCEISRGILYYFAVEYQTFSVNCWFASDVAAAMLVVKNKSISLRWEIELYFDVNLGEKFLLY